MNQAGREGLVGEPVAAPGIPGFQLVERVGTGSSGVVYRAVKDDDLGKTFAVKVFRPEQVGAYSQELQTLKRIEVVRARAGSRDLVEVVAASEAEGWGYLVLEFLPGGTLREHVAEAGWLPAADALDLLRPVLRALELLHTHGWVHGDVKPSNVLLAEDGRPRLGDFGLTHSLERLTDRGAGTPGFVAPELLFPAAGPERSGRGGAPAQPVSDVYSAAATLHFLLCGAPPRCGRPDLFALEQRHVPRPLQRALVEALRPDPSRRVSTIAELRHLLETEPRPARSSLGHGAALAALLLALAGGAHLLSPGSPPALLGAAPAADGGSRPAPDAGSSPTSPRAQEHATPPGGESAPLWDGAAISLTGPAVRWQPTGTLQVGARTFGVLDGLPAAYARSPAGGLLAAISSRGDVAVVDLLGQPSADAVLFSEEGTGSPAEDAPLAAVAVTGEFLAWTLASTDFASAGTRLRCVDLRTGTTVAAREDLPLATALALLPRADNLPWLFVGTPTGSVWRFDLETPEAAPRRVQTHQDEVLALAVASTPARLLVAGDDRGLSPLSVIGGEAVSAPGSVLGLRLQRRLRLKVFSLPTWIAGGPPSLDLDARVPLAREALRSRSIP